MTNKERIQRLIASVLTDITMNCIFALLLKLFAPLFMGIVAVEYPEWAIVHACKFTSWLIVLLTVSIPINFISYNFKSRKIEEGQNDKD